MTCLAWFAADRLWHIFPSLMSVSGHFKPGSVPETNLALVA
jgi:hypothetical protein